VIFGWRQWTLGYDGAIQQSRSDDASFTPRFIVNTLTVEAAKRHGAFFALVVSPVTADGAQRSCRLLGRSGSGGEVGGYRGMEICET